MTGLLMAPSLVPINKRFVVTGVTLLLVAVATISCDQADPELLQLHTPNQPTVSPRSITVGDVATETDLPDSWGGEGTSVATPQDFQPGEGIVAYVNGHPITVADVAEARARAENNLDGMRDEISRREADPSAQFPEQSTQGLKDRVALMEEYGLDVALLGALVHEASLFTTAVAAGHSADPVELLERVELTKRVFGTDDFPIPEAYFSAFDEEAFLSKVLPMLLERQLVIESWYSELAANAWSPEDLAQIQYKASRQALLTAEVIFTGEQGLGEATPGEALAYKEALDTLFPPPPAPAPMCANGIAIPDPRQNSALVYDCESLLTIKVALQGTASLNWSSDRPVGGWEGIVVGGDPLRVTGIVLPGKGMDGVMPRFRGGLPSLITLDFRGNKLTVDWPAGLTSLSALQELWLSGNQLHGCIPSELQTLEAHDLDSLDVDYCTLPISWRLDGDIPTPDGVLLRWTAVSNAHRYRVEYQEGDGGYYYVNDRVVDDDWVTADDWITGTSYTARGLACGTKYSFRVRANLGSTTHPAEWSEPSVQHSTSTRAC